MDKLRLKPQFTSHREVFQYLYHNKGISADVIQDLLLTPTTDPEVLVEAIAFQLDRPRYPELAHSQNLPVTSTRVLGLEPGTRTAEAVEGIASALINASRLPTPRSNYSQAPLLFYALFQAPADQQQMDILRLLRTKHYSNGQEFRDAVQSSPLTFLYKKFQSYPYHLIGADVVSSLALATVSNLAFGQVAQQNRQDPRAPNTVLELEDFNSGSDYDPNLCLGDTINNWLMTTSQDQLTLDAALSVQQITAFGFDNELERFQVNLNLITRTFCTLVHAGAVVELDGIFGADAAPVNVTKPSYKDKPSWCQEQPIPQIPLVTMRFFASAVKTSPRILRRLVTATKYKPNVIQLKEQLEDLQQQLTQLDPQSADFTQAESKIDYIERSIFVYEETMTNARDMFLYLVNRFGLALFAPIQLAAAYVIAKIQNDPEIVALLEGFGIDEENYMDYTPELRLAHLDDPEEEYLWFSPPGIELPAFLHAAPNSQQTISPYTITELISLVVGLLSSNDSNMFASLANIIIENRIKNDQEFCQKTLDSILLQQNLQNDSATTTTTTNKTLTTVEPTSAESIPESTDNESPSTIATMATTATPSRTVTAHDFLIPLHQCHDKIGFDFSILEKNDQVLRKNLIVSESLSWEENILAIAGGSPDVIKAVLRATPLLRHDGARFPLGLFSKVLTSHADSIALHDLPILYDVLLKYIAQQDEIDKVEKERQKELEKTTPIAEKEKPAAGAKGKAVSAKKPIKKAAAKTSIPAPVVKMQYDAFFNEVSAVLKSPAFWGPGAPQPGPELDHGVLNLLEKLTGNKLKLSIMESGAFSIEANRNRYVESISRSFGILANEFKLPLDPVQRQIAIKIFSKVPSALVRPMIKTLPPVLPPNISVCFTSLIFAFSRSSMVEILDAILRTLAPAIAKDPKIGADFFPSILYFGQNNLDLRNLIQVPDIDAVLYLNDEEWDAAMKTDPTKTPKMSTVATTPTTTTTSINTIFSVHRPNQLLRCLPHNNTTRLAFPQFYNYAPQYNKDEGSVNGDNTKTLLFNINTSQAIKKLPPPTFAQTLHIFNNHTRLIRESVYCTGLFDTMMNLLASQAEDPQLVQEEFSKQLEDKETMLSDSNGFRKDSLQMNPMDLDWRNYRFILPQHQYGKVDLEMLTSPLSKPPKIILQMYVTYPSILTFHDTTTTTSLGDLSFIQPSDEFNKIEYSLPYQLYEWDNDESFSVIITDTTDTTSVLPESNSSELQKYEPNYTTELVTGQDPSGLLPIYREDFLTTNFQRGLKYLERLCQLNENNPNKTERVPILRWIRTLWNTFGPGITVPIQAAASDYHPVYNAQVRGLPLALAILESLFPPHPERDFYSFRTPLVGPFALAIGPLKHELFVKNATTSFLFNIIGNFSAKSDCFYKFVDGDDDGGSDNNKVIPSAPVFPPPSLAKQLEIVKIDEEGDGDVKKFIKMSNATLIDPSATFNLNDPDSKYFYNTPGMESGIDTVLSRFYNWLSSREDVLNYLTLKEEYLNYCEEKNISPFIRLLDTSCNNILNKKVKELDWNVLCSPKPAIMVQEEGDDNNHDADEDDENGSDSVLVVDTTATDVNTVEEESHHPFITLAKSTPTWWAWDLTQFMTTSRISTLNEPSENFSELTTCRTFQIDPIERIQTEEFPSTPYPAEPDDDRVIDFTHTQLSVLNSIIFNFAETFAVNAEITLAREIRPGYEEMAGKMRETTQGLVDEDDYNSLMQLPCLNASAGYAKRVPNLRAVIYLTQHIHDIPSYIDVKQLPEYWQPPSDPLNRGLIVARSRHMAHTLASTFTKSTLAKCPDYAGDIFDLYTQQSQGFPAPVSASKMAFLFQTPLQVSFYHRNATLGFAAVNKLFFPSSASIVFHQLNAVYDQLLQQQVIKQLEEHQDEFDKQQQEEELKNSSSGYLGMFAGALGLTALIGGLSYYWFSQQQAKKKDTVQESESSNTNIVHEQQQQQQQQ